MPAASSSSSPPDLALEIRDHLDCGRFSKAVELSRTQLKTDPTHVDVHVYLGRALVSLRHFSEATEAMDELIRIDPACAMAHRIKGESLLRQKMFNQARRALERASNLNASDAKTKSLIAELDREVGGRENQESWSATTRSDSVVPPSEDTRRVEASSVKKRERPPGSKRPAGPRSVAGASSTPPAVPASAKGKSKSAAPSRPAPSAPGVKDLAPSATPRPKGSTKPSSVPPPLPKRRSGGSVKPPGRAVRAVEEPGDDHITKAFDPDARLKPARVPAEAALSGVVAGAAVGRNTKTSPAAAWSPRTGWEQPHPAAQDLVDEHTTNAQIQNPPAVVDDPLERESTRVRTPAHRLAMAVPLEAAARLRDSLKRNVPESIAAGKTFMHRITGRFKDTHPAVIIASLGAILLAILFTSVGIGYRWWSGGRAEEALQAASAQAFEDGLKSSLDEAISIAQKRDWSSAESKALKYLLLTLALIEHGEGRTAEAKKARSRLGEEDRKHPFARAAFAYAALREGRISSARKLVSKEVGNSTNGELLRAKALVHQRAGDLGLAVAPARAVAEKYPESPRHVSLAAMVVAFAGDVPGGLRMLDQIPGGEGAPAVRVARARVLMRAAKDPVRAVAEANAVLQTLRAEASAFDLAWSHLIRARHAIANGNESTAFIEAQAASGVAQAHDESFGLVLTETFLRAGGVADAAQVLESLPTISMQRERRAKLTAEVALAQRQLGRAEQALTSAGPSPHAQFLRGLLHKHRGEWAEAKRYFTQAANDPREFVRTRLHWGVVEMTTGNPERAIELLEEAFGRAPADIEVVPQLVRALLDAGFTDKALVVVNEALAVRRDAPELLAAKAQVSLARGDVSSAQRILEGLVTQRPKDPEIWVALARAYQRTGDFEGSSGAYERALALNGGYAPALYGRAELAVRRYDVEGAKKALAAVSGKGAENGRREMVSSLISVLEGAGLAAVEDLKGLAQSRKDPFLWGMLGHAHFQAEHDGDAKKAYQEAIQLDASSPDALLGLARLRLRARALDRADQYLDQAAQVAKERNLGHRYLAMVVGSQASAKYNDGDFAAAKSLAKDALTLDPNCAEAHTVLANLAMESGKSPQEHLRDALGGALVTPEAMARLAMRSPQPNSCELARRYLTAAPRGYDAKDMRNIQADCAIPTE